MVWWSSSISPSVNILLSTAVSTHYINFNFTDIINLLCLIHDNGNVPCSLSIDVHIYPIIDFHVLAILATISTYHERKKIKITETGRQSRHVDDFVVTGCKWDSRGDHLKVVSATAFPLQCKFRVIRYFEYTTLMIFWRIHWLRWLNVVLLSDEYTFSDKISIPHVHIYTHIHIPIYVYL